MCNFFPFSLHFITNTLAGSVGAGAGPVAPSGDDNNDNIADNESNGSESNPPEGVPADQKSDKSQDQDGDVTMPTLEALEPNETNG